MQEHLANRKVKDCSVIELVMAASEMSSENGWQFLSLFVTEMETEIFTTTHDTDQREMVNKIMQKIKEDER